MRRITTLLVKLVGTLAVVAAFALLVGLGIGPHTGRYRTMTVLTDSMRPTFPAGSVVVQTPMPVSEVAAGDVVTYRIPVEDRRLVTHRVVEVVESGARPVVVTRGDAVGQPDPWVARLEGPVVWKTRAGIPKLGYLLEALQQPLVRRLLVLGVPLVLALTWVVDIWRDDRRRHAPPASPVPAAPASPAAAAPHASPAAPALQWRPVARSVALGVPVVIVAAWAGGSSRQRRGGRRGPVTMVGS